MVTFLCEGGGASAAHCGRQCWYFYHAWQEEGGRGGGATAGLYNRMDIDVVKVQDGGRQTGIYTHRKFEGVQG